MSLRGAILGFLSLEPCSGYTLKQRFDGSVGSFWSATQSQIYRELHTLERERLVEPERQPGEGKPDRKVYALTAGGRAALDAWLAEPLEPLQLRHPLLLKVVFAAAAPPAAVDALLARYAEGIEVTRRDYAARLKSPGIFALARSARERTLWILAIEHGLDWCDMELAWIRRSRRALSRGRGERT
ncbi:MAG: PadR family transcriptional regulator [bacterium]|nr:PadR family transcriptional regulator [bacterium]